MLSRGPNRLTVRRFLASQRGSRCRKGGILNRPGGNATGVSVLTTELGPKRLGLIGELLVKPGTTGAHVIPDLKI
jgi:hypothetical protein